jgi:hypothetical protein
MPSDVVSTSAPIARKPEAVVAMRSLSLTRSSAASAITVSPSANAPRTATKGSSSTARTISDPPTEIGRRSPERTVTVPRGSPHTS